MATTDILGLWTPTVSDAPGEGVSFGVSSAPATDTAPVWRIDLPADPDAASALLASREEQIASAQKTINDATDRLNAFVAAQASAPSFAAPGAPLDQPEAEMLALLDAARSDGTSVSFGLGDTVKEEVTKITEEVQAFIDGVVRSVTHMAWVETQIGGQLACRTSVGWTGDTDTIWYAGAVPAHLELHRRTLALALASRNATLRTLIAAVQAAAKVSAAMAVPGGVVTALPAAWKFITQVFDQIRQQ